MGFFIYPLKVGRLCAAGNVELELNDTLMEKVKEVNKMSDKDKDYIFTLIDAFIARNKLQTILK